MKILGAIATLVIKKYHVELDNGMAVVYAQYTKDGKVATDTIHHLNGDEVTDPAICHVVREFFAQ